MRARTAVIAIPALLALAALPCGVASEFPGDNGRPFDGLPLPSGPLPPRPAARALPAGPSLELALEAARAIVEACAGFHVAVSVIDSSGTPKLYYVPDGTDGSHAYMGFRKAWTALSFGQPTSKVTELARTDAAVIARIRADSNLESFAGGMPLSVGSHLIGAIGVSGAEPSARDEACARAGVERIQARLH